MKLIAEVTAKGRVTIPQPIREALGLLPNTEVWFILEDGAVRLVKAEDPNLSKKSTIAQLKGSATEKMSTEKIMKLTRR
jgi:antitoxin PrlF